MKFKRAAGLLAALPLFLLTACSTTPSLVFTANWYYSTTNYGGVSGTSEQLTYAVTFEPSDPAASYRVEYDEGTYTTKLEDTNIAEAEGNPRGYYYETQLTVTGRYYVNGEASAEFTDSVVSKVWFLDIDKDLRPVRSEKTVYCSAPNVAAKKAKDAFVVYNYRYTSTYDTSLSKITYVYEDLKTENAEPEENTYKLGSKGTYLDNEQMLFALRGLPMNASFSFRSFDSVTRTVRTVASSDAPVAEQYTATFSMKEGDGEAVSKARTISAVSVSVGFNGNNPGSSQKYVYALCTDPGMNAYRNVLLHMETQALGSLGSFSYDLKEAIFNNK